MASQNPKLESFDMYYCKILGNLFTILGKFSLFLNWEGACIRTQDIALENPGG